MLEKIKKVLNILSIITSLALIVTSIIAYLEFEKD